VTTVSMICSTNALAIGSRSNLAGASVRPRTRAYHTNPADPGKEFEM
jgi:hypothetical protein